MDFPRLVRGRPDIPGPRRVVTAPVSARSASPARSQPPSQITGNLVETLYTHPAVRIISFSTQRGFAVSNQDISPGSLPASSPLEGTIAVGAFRIYRVPGSVAFLSCGSALQPILPRSQCWCITEDNSRFVLQVRRPQYWRIEVPVAAPDDAERALLLRRVFDNILLFEKTECPFERSFIVRLPAPPRTPIKKKAWTAEGKNLVSSAFQTELSPPAHPAAVISKGKGAETDRRGSSLSSVNLAGASGRDAKLKPDPSSYDLRPPNSVLDIGQKPRTGQDVAPNVEPIQSLPLPSPDGSQRAGVSLALPENTAQPFITAGLSYVDSSDGQGRCADAQSTSRDLAVAETGPVEGEALTGSRLSSTSCTHPYLAETQENGGSLESRAMHDEGNDEPPSRVDGITEPEVNLAETRPGLSSTSSEDQTGPSSESKVSKRRLQSAAPDQESRVGGVETFEGSGQVAPVNLTRKRASRILAGRSYTAPPQLTILASGQGASNPSLPPRAPPTPSGQSLSPSASTDSFHSVESWHSLVPPAASSPSKSPPEHATPPLDCWLGRSEIEESAKGTSFTTGASEDEMVTPRQAKCAIPGSYVASDGSGDEVELPPRRRRALVNVKSADAIRGGGTKINVPQFSSPDERGPVRRLSHATNLPISSQALSPLSPAANFFSPPARQASQGRLAAVRRLPAAIVHKTVEILLSPPGHLVNLMLKVAARIAAGEWRGLVFGRGEGGEEIPVQWDYYSDGEFSGLSDEDNYIDEKCSSSRGGGVPRSTVRHSRQWTRDDDDDCGSDDGDNNENDDGHDGHDGLGVD
ncbi:inheritance of peroxisomes protein 1-domain-containing protein [Xylariaceae sp. FL0594]|nr:inheritance of peroxisomes protein 1-domain-containing protein [Xylariaceae sp. FL0594]